MKSKSVKRYPLSKQISDKLEQMIESGEYQVGERIPTEVELMGMFEVSRNTVREAIQSLTSAGVLEVKQGDGTYVRANNRFNANMSMKYAQIPLEDMQEARNYLEAAIVNLAAQRRTEKDVEMISAAFSRRKGLKDSVKENTIADIEFHMAIAQACHNAILLDFYESISDFLESHIAVRHAETNLDITEIEELHEKLFLAIKEQKPEAAVVCAQNILKI